MTAFKTIDVCLLVLQDDSKVVFEGKHPQRGCVGGEGGMLGSPFPIATALIRFLNIFPSPSALSRGRTGRKV